MVEETFIFTYFNGFIGFIWVGVLVNGFRLYTTQDSGGRC